MRFLLVLTVIVATSVLLWGSWQWGKKPFYLILSLVLAAMIVLSIGLWRSEAEDQVRLPPEGIDVNLADIARSESGVRLSGTISNQGELDVAAVKLQTQALACPAESECQVIYQEDHTVHLYLPVGSQYQFAVVSRHPEAPEKVDRWQFRLLSKLAYPAKP